MLEIVYCCIIVENEEVYMFVSGLGEVKGLSSRTRIAINHRVFRAGNLGDQLLSLHLPSIIRGEFIAVEIDGNQKLSRHLRNQNPTLVKKL